jgi:predicted dinucleotide-binding enzyme
VIVYDPSADSVRAVGQNKTIRCAASAQECIALSDVIVLATPWQEFREVPAALWARPNRPRAVVDCWRVLNHLEGVDGVRYVRLGYGGEAERPVGVSSSAR